MEQRDFSFIQFLPIGSRDEPILKHFMRFFGRKTVEKVLQTRMHTQQKNGLNSLFKPFLGWQGQKDLNPRHAVLETAALPTELYP